MKKSRSFFLAAMILMAVFSVLPLASALIGGKSAKLAGLTLLIGLFMYFVAWSRDKSVDLLDTEGIPMALKDWSTVLLMLMPILMNVICNLIAKAALPEFIEHLKERTAFARRGNVLVLILELAISALGEEIAWRAFFQNQLAGRIPLGPALIVSSLLFALCHYSPGSCGAVLYDLSFVFINALIYGIVFHRTKNAFVSAISHLFANLFGFFYIML